MPKKEKNTETENYGYKKTNVFDAADKKTVQEIYSYAEGYMKFLDHAKIEREAVSTTIEMAKAQGFVAYDFGMPMKAGDKFYYNNRGRNAYFWTVGTEPINEGVRITAAHCDSPRLDIKQCPVYEDGGMSFLKTHYYGGLRKYQWVTVPLALHGVICKKDGTTVNVTIGENDTDPVFYINDLLPHMAQKQGAEPLNTAIPAENMNILIGSRPVSGEGSDRIKENMLALLHEKYGITEEDFLSADLFAVPAAKARDVGLDRSLIGAYGHDDRVCAYPALTALFASEDTVHTKLCILADKEEIGSDGNTGMQSELMIDLLSEIASALGGSFAAMKAHSRCISADVTACYDPNFADCYEKMNCCKINCGIALSKYTGHGGKVATNDAPAEYVAWIRRVMDEGEVIWQTADMGKADVGGGGTVAKYIAKHNIETVDMGVGVISMHSPYEVIAKCDLYEAYRAMLAFYQIG